MQLMKWIKVESEYPKIDYDNGISFTRVLVVDGGKICYATFRHLNLGTDMCSPLFHTYCEECVGGRPLGNVTHWMPLPKLPKEDE